MRKGKVSPAPDETTRTGCIACTPCPGARRSAMKSKPPATYASMTGRMAAGMS